MYREHIVAFALWPLHFSFTTRFPRHGALAAAIASSTDTLHTTALDGHAGKDEIALVLASPQGSRGA